MDAIVRPAWWRNRNRAAANHDSLYGGWGPELLSPLERFVGLFTRVRPGEGRSIALFFVQAFLLLCSYYIVRALREAFILIEFSAVVRSYAVAVMAGALMVAIPFYSLLRRRLGGERLTRLIALFFAASLLIFWGLAEAGLQFSFVFFIWVGLFNVIVVAQFWAFATDTYNLKSGQRLFPVIAVGASLGALAGAQFARLAAGSVGPSGQMLVATALLISTIWLFGPARRAVPEESRSAVVERAKHNWTGGFAVVWSEHYLRMIALFVVLLNWINSTGDYILAGIVKEEAERVAAATLGGVTSGEFITEFYGSFFTWVTLGSLGVQALLVARIYRRFGVGIALLIPPVLAVLGYGLMAFVPIFTIIQVVKVLENSTNYSLGSTNRQAVFLPTTPAAKYEGKTTTDTFFWRFGDLIQAGVVYAGVTLFDWQTMEFAVLNMLLAAAWLSVAVAIGREYRRQASINVVNVAPALASPIPDVDYQGPGPLRHRIPDSAFVDADPGDVLVYSARRADGEPLPDWLDFDPRTRTFIGQPPRNVEVVIEVVATDVDGFSAHGCFVIRRI